MNAITEQIDGRIRTEEGQDDELSLLDLLVVLAKQKWWVIGTPLVLGATALAISFAIPPTYTSTAVVIPPQQSQGSGLASAMLGQLGGLAGAGASIAGLKNPNDLYLGLLESRKIGDRMIERFDLKTRYEVKTHDAALEALRGRSTFVNRKNNGLIAIGVEDEDAKFAATLANAYVEELIALTKTMAISEASKRRAFFETQLNDAKTQLADAEVALRTTQEKTGMVQPEGQVQAIFAGIAQLRGEIAAKEVQLKALRTFATAQNPDLVRTQEELRALQAQLFKLEQDRKGRSGDLMVSTAKLPEIGVEYVRRLRDLKYQETLFEMLSKQYELAKIDESKEAALVQVLDAAMPAERKSKPKRAVIALTGAFFGLALGLLIAFAREAYLKSRSDPGTSGRWEELRRALSA